MTPGIDSLKGLSVRLLSMVIEKQVKKLYKRWGDNITIERVMETMDEGNLNTVMGFGYTLDEIKRMVEDAINKGREHF